MRKIRIDRAIYKVDDLTTTYWFLKRNPDWKNLDARENEASKLSLNGYTRIFRNGRMKKFNGSGHP